MQLKRGENSPTMTITDVVKALRANGIPSTPARVAENIASGRWDFGKLLLTHGAQRRRFEIWRSDFESWLAERLPPAK